MNTDAGFLSSLNSKFNGYLEGEDVDAFLKEVGIKFAAGHWAAGEFFDRFCPVGYNSKDLNFKDGIVEQIKRVSQAKIQGIEFHDMVFIDDQGAAMPQTISDVKAALTQYNVTPTNMNFNLWTNPDFKWGSITHPDPGVRKQAKDQVHLGIEIAKDLGCVSCGLWPGSDGWDYHFEVDYGKRFAWYVDGCTEFASHCNELGLAFGTEPKQKEPREGNMIINTVAKAALVCIEVNKNLGKPIMGVAIDYGHEQMVGNTPADSLYLLKHMGIPIANFHINGAKYNSNDEDRIAGTDDIWRLAEFCYAAIDTGYDGWFGEDQFTYRTEQVISMALSKEFFANCMKKALKIYAQKPALDAAIATGDAINTIQLVKKIIYNG